MPSKNHTSPEIARFKRFLKSRDLKATPQRIAVHEAMSVLGHASAEEVSGYITLHSNTDVSLSSVYGTLTLFTSLGLYSIRPSADNRQIFDSDPDSHIHLYDPNSGEFKAIEDSGLKEAVESLLKGRKWRGYKADSLDIQIICHKTRKK